MGQGKLVGIPAQLFLDVCTALRALHGEKMLTMHAGPPGWEQTKELLDALADLAAAWQTLPGADRRENPPAGLERSRKRCEGDGDVVAAAAYSLRKLYGERLLTAAGRPPGLATAAFYREIERAERAWQQLLTEEAARAAYEEMRRAAPRGGPRLRLQ